MPNRRNNRNRRKQKPKPKNKSKNTKTTNNDTKTENNNTNELVTRNEHTNSNNRNENNTNQDEQTDNTTESTEQKSKNPKEDLKNKMFDRTNKYANSKNKESHKFWDEQPVPKMKEKIKTETNEAIETKTLQEVRKQPYLLPQAFEWSNLDLNDGKTLDELYTLLYEHYVEDDDNMFRFNYGKEFLKWALLVPEYLQQWHLGVRVAQSGKLVGCITAIPAKTSIKKKIVKMVEINFLCVHKKLRDKRLAPVLIKEITRRVNCQNIWQAVYTAGIVIPKPIAQNRYWHRNLNPKKLVEIKFTSLRQRMTMPRLMKLCRLPEKTSLPGLRQMKLEDAEQVHKLLLSYLSQFDLHIQFSLEEIKHILLPRKNVVHSYVVENPETKKITDLISFYELPNSVLNNPKYNELKIAYSYYNVASSKDNWIPLMTDALILAKSMDFDVFNALDVMENSTFLKSLKFGIGDGHLQYYLYNWRTSELKPSDVGIVLL